MAVNGPTRTVRGTNLAEPLSAEVARDIAIALGIRSVKPPLTGLFVLANYDEVASGPDQIVPGSSLPKAAVEERINPNSSPATRQTSNQPEQKAPHSLDPAAADRRWHRRPQIQHL